MHYFGIPRYTQSMIAYKISTEYLWKSQWKLPCGSVDNLPYCWTRISEKLSLNVLRCHWLWMCWTPIIYCVVFFQTIWMLNLSGCKSIVIDASCIGLYFEETYFCMTRFSKLKQQWAKQSDRSRILIWVLSRQPKEQNQCPRIIQFLQFTSLLHENFK